MSSDKLSEALWRIYNRPERPFPFQNPNDANLPWDDPAFSERMLREHLDESHGAASRQASERAAQIQWLWEKMGLAEGQRLLDITCGPGLYAVPLATRGLRVTGVDFGPAAIAYAQELAVAANVTDRCHFLQQDVRQMQLAEASFDAALLLYGQLAVMTRDEAQAVLQQAAKAVKPGGKLVVELLNPEQIDKKESTWWYTDDSGLWGERPYLHLGERFWHEAEKASVERFTILDLETAALQTILLCDQSYEPDDMKKMMRQAGFSTVAVYPAWDGLALYDAEEWLVYVATR